MNRSRPPITLNRVAGFSDDGYLFDWRPDPAFLGAPPLVFHVEESDTPDGPWNTISPELVETYVWQENTRRVLNRDDTRYFRVRMTSGMSTLYSPAIADKRPQSIEKELILSEILRRERLIARVKTGVEGSIFLRNRYGSNCTRCTDDVLDVVMEGSFCKLCGGFKKVPPLFGPYPAWFTMSTGIRLTANAEDGVGKVTAGTYQFRVASPIQIKSSDVLRGTDTARMYYVDKVQIVAEISGSPAIQEAVVNEIPTTDRLYQLEVFNGK